MAKRPKYGSPPTRTVRIVPDASQESDSDPTSDAFDDMRELAPKGRAPQLSPRLSVVPRRGRSPVQLVERLEYLPPHLKKGRGTPDDVA